MSKTTVITARVPPDIVEALDKLGERVGRSRAWLVAEAVREYTAEQSAFLDFIDEGERDIDEGRFYTREEMERWLDEQIALAESAKRAKAA